VNLAGDELLALPLSPASDHEAETENTGDFARYPTPRRKMAPATTDTRGTRGRFAKEADLTVSRWHFAIDGYLRACATYRFA
jgi:hypothetical protein